MNGRVSSTIELSDRARALLLPPAPGPDVCAECFNFTRGYRECFSCAHAHRGIQGDDPLAALVPISYSVGSEELHHLLADYKRCSGFVAARATRILAAILERFLVEHERCVAAAAGVAGFDLVATVPSSSAERDDDHPLRRIVDELVGVTRGRHRRLLRRSDAPAAPHRLDPRRYRASARIDGASVMLIDDTWTTGASARSAACALRAAGAANVAAVVIGRHVNRGWHHNDRRLDALSGRFDWARCAVCAGSRQVRQAA
jgi:hypothetical protein